VASPHKAAGDRAAGGRGVDRLTKREPHGRERGHRKLRHLVQDRLADLKLLLGQVRGVPLVLDRLVLAAPGLRRDARRGGVRERHAAVLLLLVLRLGGRVVAAALLRRHGHCCTHKIAPRLGFAGRGGGDGGGREGV